MSRAGWGVTTESHVSAIIPDSEVTALPGTAVVAGSSPIGQSVQIGRDALVGASYGAYRINDKLVLGVGVNAPFGLSVEAEDPVWAGQRHFRSAKIFTVNVNPMLAYAITPSLSVGIGAQVQWGKITFKSQPNPAVVSQSNSGFEVDDTAFGFTAGALWQPAAGTSIGLGFRSALNHEFEGDQFIVGGLLNVRRLLPVPDAPVKAEVTLPEMVTLSISQALSPTTRLLGTVEWTNWSRLGTVDFVNTGGVPQARFDFNWNDGWFFALGAEWDMSRSLTLRTGVAYEISPIQHADQRFAAITDSDRIWLSAGATYRISDTMSVDLAYSHIFFDDAPIDRARPPGTSGANNRLVADADQSADILSASLKIKWGGAPGQ